MLTVTLGTIPYPFERLISWLHALLESQTISEPVFIQSGATDVSRVADHPLVTTARVVESKKLIELIKQSRLVISHAGQGSACLLAAQKASFVLVPRLTQHREHIDNHQLLFAQSVRQFGIQYCMNLEDLQNVILCPPEPFEGRLFTGPKLVDHLIKTYPIRASSTSTSREEQPSQPQPVHGFAQQFAKNPTALAEVNAGLPLPKLYLNYLRSAINSSYRKEGGL